MKKIKALIATLAFYIASLISPALFADSTEQEINHLINYVAASACLFIRNGREHTGPQAIEHIEKKYKYFRKKIFSAKKFIELSASKSTITGRPYQIKCSDEKRQESRSWLLAELKRYREISVTYPMLDKAEL